MNVLYRGLFISLLASAATLASAHNPVAAQGQTDLTTLSLQDLLKVDVISINVLGTHIHPAGQWMLGYEYMFEDMDGNRAGTHRVSHAGVLEGYATAPTDMSMQMHMAMAMYAPTNELSLDVNAGVRRGDVESTSQRSFQIFRASSAITPDPVWGDPNLIAYRLRGTTWSGGLAASYALSDHSSLDAAYHYDFTRAAEGLEYTTNLIVLTYIYRF